jgi:hypothetical protein
VGQNRGLASERGEAERAGDEGEAEGVVEDVIGVVRRKGVVLRSLAIGSLAVPKSFSESFIASAC